MLLLLLLSAVFCAEHCLPDQFSYESWMAVPDKVFDDRQKIYFDYTNKRVRADVYIVDPAIAFYQTFDFFDQKSRYVYDVQTKTCVQQPLLHEMERICLFRDAKHLRDVTVGTAKCSVWMEQYEHWDEVITIEHGTGIPVTLMVMGERRQAAGHALFEAFYNFVSTVDPSEFQLPDACKDA